MKTLILLIFITFIFSSTTSWAQARGDSFSIGPGIALSNNIRVENSLSGKDRDTISQVFPALSFSYGRLALRGMGLDFSLYQSPLFLIKRLYLKLEDYEINPFRLKGN